MCIDQERLSQVSPNLVFRSINSYFLVVVNLKGKKKVRCNNCPYIVGEQHGPPSNHTVLFIFVGFQSTVSILFSAVVVSLSSRLRKYFPKDL